MCRHRLPPPSRMRCGSRHYASIWPSCLPGLGVLGVDRLRLGRDLGGLLALAHLASVVCGAHAKNSGRAEGRAWAAGAGRSACIAQPPGSGGRGHGRRLTVHLEALLVGALHHAAARGAREELERAAAGEELSQAHLSRFGAHHGGSRAERRRSDEARSPATSEHGRPALSDGGGGQRATRSEGVFELGR